MQLDKYKLVNIDKDYKDLIFHWRNSDHIRRNMYTERLLTKEEHAHWFKRILLDDTIDAKLFVYEEQPIGFINFTNLNPENGTCSWGFYIGCQDTPKGSGQVMACLALNYVFNELKLRKVCSEILEFNKRSYYFHKKLGFREEGRLKEHVYRKNRYLDVILMALFKDTWLK